MMHVKECLYLCIFFIITVIFIAFTFHRQDTSNSKSEINMGSILSTLSRDRSVSDHIEQLIHKYPVMIFSKSYCPYSKRAKSIFSKYRLGSNYFVLELDQLPSKSIEYQNELGKLTGATTVPRVFIGGKFIGGGDDTVLLEEKGDLKRRLQEAQAIVDENENFFK